MKKYLLPIIVSLLIVASSVVAITKIMPYQGGTGQDSSNWTGFIRVSGGTWSTTTVSASDVDVLQLGSPTYTNVQDWLNTTQSAGKLTGGDITDNGNGTVKVAAGTGFIKTTDSDVANTKFFDWSVNNSLSLTDNATNYIYVEYNSGSPQIVASTSTPSDKNTNVLLGLVYRDGTDLYITTAGQVISNYAKNTLWKDLEVNGKFQRVNGIMISETGTRNIAITSGFVYAGLTKEAFPAFDSSGTDTFTYYYRDGSGGWTKVTGQSQIDNLHYDDGSGTLAELSSQSGWRKYYGVHWVYATIDGSIFVVYGQGNYLLSDAENAQPPSSLPDIIESVGMIVGKIIIEKGSDTFESVESAFDVFFVPHTVANHNELSGLQGGTTDEYYHLTASEHTTLTNWASSGIDISDDTNLAVSGTLLNLTGDTLSVNEGTLTDSKLCKYVAGTGLVCDYTDQDTTYTAGRSLTLTGTQFDVDAELYQKTLSFDWLGVDASKELKYKVRNAITINKVYCNSVNGTTTISLFERTLASPDSGGSAILNASLTCGNGAGIASTTSFADSAIAADAIIVATSTIDGTPDCSIFIDYTIND